MKKTWKILLALSIVALLGLSPISSQGAVALGSAPTTGLKAGKEGWVTKSGKKYYYVKGKKVTGIHKIGSKNYAFDSKGVLQGKTPVFTWKNKFYKVSAKGVASQWKGTAAFAAKLLTSAPLSGKTAEEQLIKAFNYCADLNYMRISAPAGYSEKQLLDYFGKIGLTQQVGDCSVQATSFYWLAKVLGYNVKVVNGYTKSTTFNEHSWVELTKSKKVYICDPNFSKEYRDRIAVTGKYPLGLLVRYGAKNTLKYFRQDQSEIETNGKA